jgi:hypothetical protein
MPKHDKMVWCLFSVLSFVTPALWVYVVVVL